MCAMALRDGGIECCRWGVVIKKGGEKVAQAERKSDGRVMFSIALPLDLLGHVHSLANVARADAGP